MNERQDLAIRFNQLSRGLNLPTYATEGLLSALWRLAEESHDTGSTIGKISHSAEKLAKAVDWVGEPRLLVTGLIFSGWIYPVDNGFIVVGFSSGRTWWGQKYSTETCGGCGEPI